MESSGTKIVKNWNETYTSTLHYKKNTKQNFRTKYEHINNKIKLEMNNEK